MKGDNSTDDIEFSTVIPPVISLKFNSTPNYIVPNFDAYDLVCTFKGNLSIVKQAFSPGKEAIMT